jgi:hypothetical protein
MRAAQSSTIERVILDNSISLVLSRPKLTLLSNRPRLCRNPFARLGARGDPRSWGQATVTQVGWAPFLPAGLARTAPGTPGPTTKKLEPIAGVPRRSWRDFHLDDHWLPARFLQCLPRSCPAVSRVSCGRPAWCAMRRNWTFPGPDRHDRIAVDRPVIRKVIEYY